ncbi:MAG: tRNA (guanosine(46)-N7)-methyltransferase TrmB [Opitutales bacterium]|nr:tRNA (guanosine(46)-N7)-methyltransferase TrmB [Opitutales bacterium]
MEMLPPGQQAYLEEKAQRIANLRQSLTELYPERTPLVLELGCGHGHFLASYAEAHPELKFLGIDLVSRRIQLARGKAIRRNLKNLAFLKAEASELLSALPSTVRVKAVFMLFPDPWPKQRHWKNRMVQRPLLQALHEKLFPEGRFFFRTDHQGYFEWSRQMIQETDGWAFRECGQWPHEVETIFQKITGGQYHSLIVEAIKRPQFERA